MKFFPNFIKSLFIGFSAIGILSLIITVTFSEEGKPLHEFLGHTFAAALFIFLTILILGGIFYAIFKDKKPTINLTKEVKKQNITRREIISGLKSGALLYAVSGFWVSKIKFKNKTLQDIIYEGDVWDRIFYLEGKAPPDVIIVGTTDNIYCHNFVREGAAEFLKTAREMSCSVAYMGIPTGYASLASTRALGIVVPGDHPFGALGVLQATYAFSDEVANGLPEEKMGQRLAELVGDPDLSALWTKPNALYIQEYGQKIVDALSVQTTPSFYVASQSDPTDIRVFTGFSNAAETNALLRDARTRA